jgi:hypothetical protein
MKGGVKVGALANFTYGSVDYTGKNIGWLSVPLIALAIFLSWLGVFLVILAKTAVVLAAYFTVKQGKV